MKVTVTGTRSVINRLLGMQARAKDMRPVFRWAQRELEEANRKNFATRGAASGAPWMPLDDHYARWKLAHHGPRPLMVQTSALMRSLTYLHGSPNHIGATSAVFGTDIPYAKFHQAGTSKMPQRKIVFVPELFTAELAVQAKDHIMYGSKPGSVATGRLRSVMTT